MSEAIIAPAPFFDSTFTNISRVFKSKISCFSKEQFCKLNIFEGIAPICCNAKNSVISINIRNEKINQKDSFWKKPFLLQQKFNESRENLPFYFKKFQMQLNMTMFQIKLNEIPNKCLQKVSMI